MIFLNSSGTAKQGEKKASYFASSCAFSAGFGCGFLMVEANFKIKFLFLYAKFCKNLGILFNIFFSFGLKRFKLGWVSLKTQGKSALLAKFAILFFALVISSL